MRAKATRRRHRKSKKSSRRPRGRRNQKGGAESYTAVIVEPRKHRALEFVLQNALENLDERWTILVYHGTENAEWLQEILRKPALAPFQKRIVLQNLGRPDLTIADYNALMTSADFVRSIPTEVFLVFQTDSMICPQHRGKLVEFLEYDYVGAPWKDSDKVGNGGFSLRRKSKMLEIIEKCTHSDINEDLFFALGCDAVKPRAPSYEKAQEFSIESIDVPASFGVHKPWGAYEKSFEPQCTGYDTLRSLQATD